MSSSLLPHHLLSFFLPGQVPSLLPASRLSQVYPATQASMALSSPSVVQLSPILFHLRGLLRPMSRYIVLPCHFNFNPADLSSQKKVTKPDVNLDPSWSEIWRRIRRISPYLWPSGSLPLQGLAVSVDFNC